MATTHDKQPAIERLINGFLDKLKPVLGEVLEEAAEAFADKSEPAPAKLGVVKGTGTDGVASDPDAKTDPPPPPADAPSNVRQFRPAT